MTESTEVTPEEKPSEAKKAQAKKAAKPTHVVNHERCYLAVHGQMELQPKGTLLSLNKKQAEKAAKSDKLLPYDPKKTVDVS